MIRPATAADLDAIDAIEHHSFKTTWPRATFEGELAHDWAHLDVLEDDRAGIVAFCNYWLVVPEVNILAIATHPDHRGRGLGARVLAHVLELARRESCTLATLEVRRTNAPALALYSRAGFQIVHVRERYYQDSEDALVMLLDL
ncbi:MAG TPA: ribosomal protein S18-alanine N-acetyltransferase [Kofleriaceae bacterium]